DCNVDGVKASDEAVRAGVAVYLDLNNNGSADTGEPMTTTDSGGNFSFGNLAPGTYRVRDVVPTGFLQTTPGLATVVVTAGGTAAGTKFGVAADKSAIADYLFLVNGTTAYADLRGNTNATDMVDV